MRAILRENRVKNGYTQESISMELGIGRSTYTNIELGNKNPSFTLSIKIKELLKYEKDDIFLNSKCQKGTND